MRNSVFIVLLSLTCLHGYGQDVTIVNRFPDAEAQEQPDAYVLKKVTQHTYVVNEYEPSQAGPQAQLMQLISYSLRSYTDNQYYTSGNAVMAIEEGVAFAKAAAAIVRNAIWIHDYDFHEEFPGFGNEVASTAQELSSLDAFALHTHQGEGIDKPKRMVELYYFQRLVYNLKVMMEKEVSLFLDKKIASPSLPAMPLTTSEESMSPQLAHLDIRLEPIKDVGAELADLKPIIPVDFGSPTGAKRSRRRNRQPAYAEQMVSLLQENNKILANFGSRFENIQGQIDAERMARREDLAMVREEVSLLSDLVKLIATGGLPSTTAAGQGSGIMEVEIVFDKNEHDLTLAHKANLNRIEIAMRQDAALSADITGFADRSGDSNFNAWISDQRAKAVRDYLAGLGLSPERLVVRFVGDAESQSANPADRKVVVVLR